MIQILKKQGVKAALPLLLLATACGDGPSAALQADAVTGAASDGDVTAVESNDSGIPAIGDMDFSAPESAEAKAVDLDAVAFSDEPSTKVPEPTAIAGLAVAALGLGAIKRKQSA
ncbi:MAG: PEP-CTERM sorting domain-containing protein [Cyanobacteria bacterium J06597_16]